MQIRLTVVDPLGPPDRARDRAASCDVLVTAPAGTALSAVASALASAVAGDGALSERGREPGGPVVLYAGAQRLDDRRCTLGEPPLIDGAVLALGAPAEPEPHPELDDAPTQLHVTAGPDAGGVHLLHGGEIRIGRSADADVPLDDPDVSRLHCAVTLAPDGRVSVADLGSTNGTLLDGVRVTGRPVRFAPGALLRIGESALRLTPAGGPGARVRTAPDGEGHVRVSRPEGAASARTDPGRLPHARVGDGAQQISMVPGQAGAPRIETRPPYGAGDPHAGRGGATASDAARRDPRDPSTPNTTDAGHRTGGRDTPGAEGHGRPAGHGTESAVDRRAPDASGHGSAPGYGTAPADPRTDGAHGAPASPYGTGERGSSRAGGPGRNAPAPDPRGDTPPYGTGHGGHGTPRDRAGDPHAPYDPHDPHAPYDSHAPYGDPRGDAGDGREAGRAGAAPGGPGTDHGTGTPRYGASPDATGGHRAEEYGTDAPRGQAGARGSSGTDDGRDSRDSRDSRRGNVPPHRAAADRAAARDREAPGAAGRRKGGLSAWARRLTGTRAEHDPYEYDEHDERDARDDRDGHSGHGGYDGYDGRPASGGRDDRGGRPARSPGQEPPVAGAVGDASPEIWPDAASLLLTALGPGPRLWERAPGHPEALTVRLGTADRTAPDGTGPLPAVPVTADLREAGALGLAGPRTRLAGLARAVLAQLAALHAPESLEIVLISADRARTVAERTAEWSWLGWLPHLRPGHGQDCRLLLAYDREQAAARADELLRRLEDRPAGSNPPYGGPYTVLIVDGDVGDHAVGDAVARLALEGPRAGVHVVCLAETEAAAPDAPVTEAYEAACAVAPAFRECGAVALLSGDVATALRLVRVARAPREPVPTPVGPGTIAAVDAVSAAWSERFARALAPLRQDGTAGGAAQPRVSLPLPQAARLLDELGLARATPASLMARWADAADDPESLGGRASAVLGAGPRGPVTADLAADGPHLLVEGPAGSGRTELLRALVASLAAAERPDRLSVVLVDGRDGVGAASGHGDGLRVCTDVPHVTTHLTANDPVRMREFAQSLSAELKRRAELVGRGGFADRHAGRAVPGRLVAPRDASAGAADLDSAPSATIRLRPAAHRQQRQQPPSLPRLVVVVDDLDALVSPALGSPGRPAAGSVMRALEAVAREGERLGVHLVAATGPGGRTAETEPSRLATLRVLLDAPGAGPDAPAPGRGRLVLPDGASTPFQGGRVTGRIPRTATLRPTVVALDWPRMGDPPTRRPVRELGNGPTDLALLASALERAAKQVAATEVPSLL
ncbi:FHA domain-containing protein [Streptomyces griseoviridis]